MIGSLVLLERRKLIRVPQFLIFTGDMSYTIYLSHLLVLGVIGHVWQRIGAWPDSIWDNLFFLLLMMSAVICYGALAYRFSKSRCWIGLRRIAIAPLRSNVRLANPTRPNDRRTWAAGRRPRATLLEWRLFFRS